jgi:ComF family protein
MVQPGDKWKQFIFSGASRLRDIVLPANCVHCGTFGARHGALCPNCWSRVQFVERPFCEILGKPFDYDQGPGAVCPEAIAEPPSFARLRSRALYGDVVRSLISGLKFSDRTDLARWMAYWLVPAGQELAVDCSLCMPVPLHPWRQHARRYNQSAELARHVARLTGLQYEPLALARSRATRRQLGLSATERIRNVQGAFRVTAEKRPIVEGRRILLIDDVYTTGATVNACSRALLRAGAQAVDVLTFATVPATYI